jgi:oligopeptidase B
MLLYAYGSYGVSVAPTFSSSRLVLLDRGVVYAIAHRQSRHNSSPTVPFG